MPRPFGAARKRKCRAVQQGQGLRSLGLQPVAWRRMPHILAFAFLQPPSHRNFHRHGDFLSQMFRSCSEEPAKFARWSKTQWAKVPALRLFETVGETLGETEGETVGVDRSAAGRDFGSSPKNPIIERSFWPTCSMSCTCSSARRALKRGRPARFSSIQPRAYRPS